MTELTEVRQLWQYITGRKEGGGNRAHGLLKRDLCYTGQIRQVYRHVQVRHSSKVRARVHDLIKGAGVHVVILLKGQGWGTCGH